MKKLKFKTNINCGGCIATVTPFLDQVVGAGNWDVDIESKHKILNISIDGAKEEEVIESVEKAGFTIKPLKKGLMSGLFG